MAPSRIAQSLTKSGLSSGLGTARPLEHASVSLWEGSGTETGVGEEVEAGVGEEVGAGVGEEVGAGVGEEVGAGVGEEVGAGVGVDGGVDVGIGVGAGVGVGSSEQEVSSSPAMAANAARAVKQDIRDIISFI